jgi:glycosyltransferase involved in cell wall biosynthesis
MSRRRICVTAPQVPFLRGGAELHAELLVQALKEEGHEVDLVTLPYIWTGDRSSLEQALAWRMVDLAVEVNRVPTDLVIATKFPSYLIRHPNKVAWIFHQQREVYDLHGTPFGPFSMSEDHQGLRQALVEMDLQALGEARALFSNSANTAARLTRYCGVSARPLYAPPKLYQELHPGPYEDYILYVGRLDRIKRIDMAIEALRHTRAPVELRVAGRGPHLEELQQLAREHDLHDRVTFLGFVSDAEVVDLYANCFAVLLTPHDEDYGFTTLEAFFSGKPVVTTTDSGGVLEFVEDAVNGFVEPPEPRRLAARIDTLYDDRSLCEAFGAAGRELVREKVSWAIALEALTATVE